MIPGILLYTIGFVVTVVIALLITPFIIKFSYMIGAIDKPDPRKVHNKIMPRLGGLSIYLAFIVGYVVFSMLVADWYFDYADMSFVYGLFTGGTIIVILGVLDDRFILPAKIKLVVQIIAAVVVVVGFDVRIELVNLPFYDSLSPVAAWISIPVTILWIVAVTNAINLIDGLDGLAAGVSAIAITTILVMAAVMGNVPIIILSSLLLGSILGFLRYNFYPAKIFMGDTGSLLLGFCLATLSMIGFKQVTIVSFLTPLLIIGVPLSDTFFAIVRRLVNKRPIFAPDKNHLHHCLQNIGFSHRQTVLIIYGIATLFGIFAVVQTLYLQYYVPNWIIFTSVIVIILMLQIGAEVIGIVDKSKRPVIDFVQKLLVGMFQRGLK